MSELSIRIHSTHALEEHPHFLDWCLKKNLKVQLCDRDYDFDLLKEGQIFKPRNDENRALFVSIFFEAPGASLEKSWFLQLPQVFPDFVIGFDEKFVAAARIFEKAFELLLEKRQGALEREKILSRNKKLEDLQHGLSREVSRQTEKEQSAKIEVHRRLEITRGLLRFVKELSLAGTPEEVLRLTRNQFKKHPKIFSPTLCRLRSDGKGVHYFFQGAQVVGHPAKKIFDPLSRIRPDDLNIQRYLADELERPFRKCLVVPLGFDGGAYRGMLVIEHGLEKEDSEKFLDLNIDRFQAISMALDRVFLEDELFRSTRLWQKTFDGFEDPVAIVDQNFRLIRANRSFQSQDFRDKCFQSFAEGVEPCRGCPLLEEQMGSESKIFNRGQSYLAKSYPIDQGSAASTKLFVNHYENRTESLELQSKMFDAEKMSALGQLAGHVAHELNNPLTGIRSLAQILRKDLEREKTKTQQEADLVRDVEEIEAGAQRCQRIVNELLDFTRGGVERKEVELNELLETSLKFGKSLLSSVQAEFEYSSESLKVTVAPQLIQQVFFNLMKNACEAVGEKGKVQVRVFSQDFEGRRWACAQIRDNGPGLSPLEIEQIFTPFYTTKPEGLGTGLGLSLCQRIIEDHSGFIGVRSAKGAEFTVFLPLLSPRQVGETK